jgi:hypothetical protein
MREVGKYSIQPYSRKFGSWSNALKKAGYEPNLEREVQKEGHEYDYDLYDEQWAKKSYQIRDWYGKCIICGTDPAELDRRNQSLNAHHVSTRDKEPVVDVEGVRPAKHVVLCPDCHNTWDWIEIGPDVRIEMPDTENQQPDKEVK